MYKINQLKIEPLISNIHATDVTYIIKNMSNNFSRTLMNMIRSNILSYAPEYVVVNLNIPTLTSRLNSLTNVATSTSDIVNNLANIKIKIDEEKENPEFITLKYTGNKEGDIVLGDFSVSEDVEVLNGDLVILKTTTESQLEIIITMKLTYPHEIIKLTSQEGLDISPVFSAIQSCMIKIELDNPIPGKSTGILTVKTDGTITAPTAIKTAMTVFLEQYKQLINMLDADELLQQISNAELTTLKALREKDNIDLIMSQPIEEVYYKLSLNTEDFNLMKSMQLNTLKDIVAYSGDCKEINSVKQKVISTLQESNIIIK